MDGKEQRMKTCNTCVHDNTEVCDSCSQRTGDKCCTCFQMTPCGFCENNYYEES
jgi:hypothetical protein